MPIPLLPTFKMKARLMAKITAPLFAFALCLGLSTTPLAHAQTETDATIGEIKTFAFRVCPPNTMATDGRTLLVARNDALFLILGTTFGGDGTVNFKLPDLAGRAIIGDTATTDLGAKAGVASTLLNMSQMPLGLGERPAAMRNGPVTLGGRVTTGLTAVGAVEPVVTMPPYLALRQCIVSDGVFPSLPQ
jgi:microcystin-dependent protein